MPITPLYRFIRMLFRVTSGTFYATIEVHGEDNVPKEGEPCILCFNHGNGLADPKIVIRATPRMVRFCAKDTLWNIPVMGQLVKYSGAVPVYRSTEHGSEAGDLNKTAFREVFKALHNGQMLGFAPEGVSRFLPFMAKPFKTGVARISLTAVEEQKDDPNFKIKILPTGITFTHREKFRSDVAVIYGKPIVVDRSWLEGNGRFDTREQAVRHLTKQLQHDLHSITINCPDWETTQVAMTAARLNRPLGTRISLRDYLLHLRGWVALLQPPEEGEMRADIKAFRLQLAAYQKLLNFKKIKDQRVRQCEKHGPIPSCVIVMRMLQRLILCAVSLALASPGLLMWVPPRLYIKWRERQLLDKGPRWNDSVAEMKMLFGTGAVLSILLLVFVVAPWTVCALAVPYLWLTVRLYEEFVASGRSLYTLWKLLFLTKETMTVLRTMRRECHSLVQELVKEIPPESLTAEHAAENNDSGYCRIPWYSPVWFEWPWTSFMLSVFLRRKKNDWNEVLRLNDFNTMNYFE